MIFIVGSLIFVGPLATTFHLEALFLTGCFFFFTGVYIKTTQVTGEVSVLLDGLCIEQEGRKECFSKQDLLYVAQGELTLSRGSGIFVRFQNQQGEKRFEPCFIRPCHYTLSATYDGVVLITPKSKRAIFIPTKNPEKLLEALEGIR